MVEKKKAIFLVVTNQQHEWLTRVKMMMSAHFGRPIKWEEAAMLAFQAWDEEHQRQKEALETQVKQNE